MEQSIIHIQKKLLPDLLVVMQRRYDILRYIGLLQPVGRRSLSANLGITERVLRGEVEFLKEQHLLQTTKSGMILTTEGTMLLEQLETMMKDITGVRELEQSLQRQFSIENVVVVPGNCDESPWVKKELGRACATYMKERLVGENIIAVTGGSTMAAVANMLTDDMGNDLLFVPARGGIGLEIENQANAIVAKMAENTGTSHRVLYVPDEMSSEMLATITKEKDIEEVLRLIRSATMILHGIGDAITMANRRKTNEEVIALLKEQNAVGEAFGYYFNEDGEIVHRLSTVGLHLEDLRNAKHVIAVAGGSSKAKAIQSYMKLAPKHTVLITDEGAAKRLLTE